MKAGLSYLYDCFIPGFDIGTGVETESHSCIDEGRGTVQVLEK